MARLLPVLVVLLCLVSTELLAQVLPTRSDDSPARQVHWAMGAFFGTGWYQIDENRRVFILRAAPRQTLKTASIDDQGQRTLGVEILYPVTLGLHNLDDLPDIIDFDNYATASFTPGIQVEIPVTEKWHLRPYAHFGWGTESNLSDSAWIYYGGIKSRVRLYEKRTRWSLINGLHYAGYQPEFEERGRFASFMTGLEFEQPLKRFNLGGDDLWLNWRLGYNRFFDKVNFHVNPDRVDSIKDQWDFGLALSKGDKKIKFWFVEFEHIGLAYKWSSNGRYKAVSINLSSPFTS